LLLLLAEISDKMPTIFELWFLPCALTLPFAIAVAMNCRLSLAVAPMAIVFTIFLFWLNFGQSFLEGDDSVAIWKELGPVWVVNSILSCIFPILLVFVAVKFGQMPPTRARVTQTGPL